MQLNQTYFEIWKSYSIKTLVLNSYYFSPIISNTIMYPSCLELPLLVADLGFVLSWEHRPQVAKVVNSLLSE